MERGISLQRRLHVPVPLTGLFRRVAAGTRQSHPECGGRHWLEGSHPGSRAAAAVADGDYGAGSYPRVLNHHRRYRAWDRAETSPAAVSRCSLRQRENRVRGWVFGWCVPWSRSRVGASGFAPARPPNATSQERFLISGFRWNHRPLQHQLSRTHFPRVRVEAHDWLAE